MEHELKTDPELYDETVNGRKTFEIRKNDRGFKEGDFLQLRQTRYTGEEMKNGKPLEYTGQQARLVVDYILQGPVFGLADGWVIMSVL